MEFHLCECTSSSASNLPRQLSVQVILNTNIYCVDKLDEISDLKVFLNASAGHLWPAGLLLPTPALNQYGKNLL